MTSMEERFNAIQEDSDFNNLPFETRKMISKYTAEQQMLTLYQVLHKHGDLTTTAWRAKIRVWLNNCIRTYEREYRHGCRTDQDGFCYYGERKDDG